MTVQEGSRKRRRDSRTVPSNGPSHLPCLCTSYGLARRRFVTEGRSLLTQRTYWQAIRENPTLIPTLVEECLRFDTPGQSLLRVATQEVEFSGVTIPQGAIVLLLESSAD